MNPLNRMMVPVLQMLPRSIVKRFAWRYIAGEKIEDAVRVVKSLNLISLMATLDVLGENVSTKEASLKAAAEYEEVLHRIDRERLNVNLSIKLSQFGLKMDEAFCYENVRHLLEVARGYHNFVRIDMEDSSTTGETLRLYERLRSAGLDNTGIVIQAYLRRSEADVRRIAEKRGNVRLCKGAYIEPEAIAFQERDEIRLNYLKLLRILFDARCYVGIATHDDFLVDGVRKILRGTGLRPSDYEFQMLYGVKTDLRDRILAEGHRLRVYVPFGQEWFAYSIRRFKENPRLLTYILRAVFSSR
jgi:proline dehydrogenase